MTIEAKRTPDERFADLPGYDYPPHYVADLPGYEGLRMHYVDTGESEAETTFLCLHGEPSWAYLYRKMMPLFVGAGHRAVAPDFFGFGRSDKPVAHEIYSFHFHRNAVMRLIERLDLHNVCLVVQDWGGLIGLTLPMEYPDRITRLLVMNTALAVGRPAGKGFNDWKRYVAENPDFGIAALFRRAVPGLTEAEAAAYEAPFPDASYRAGVTTFPQLVMIEPHMEGVVESRHAYMFLSEQWSGEAFIAVGMQDPVLGPAIMVRLQETIRNCSPLLEVPAGGHFLQEHGEPVARAALDHFGL